MLKRRVIPCLDIKNGRVVKGVHFANLRDTGDPADDVDEGVTALGRRGDVEQAQLVGTLRVVGPSGLDRIAGVAQALEVDALDHAAVLDVEAGDDAAFQHRAGA